MSNAKPKPQAPGHHPQEPEGHDVTGLRGELRTAEEVLSNLLMRINNDVAMSGQGKGTVPRWLNLARTDFERGLMWLEKAIDRPSGGIGDPR